MKNLALELKTKSQGACAPPPPIRRGCDGLVCFQLLAIYGPSNPVQIEVPKKFCLFLCVFICLLAGLFAVVFVLRKVHFYQRPISGMDWNTVIQAYGYRDSIYARPVFKNSNSNPVTTVVTSNP